MRRNWLAIGLTLAGLSAVAFFPFAPRPALAGGPAPVTVASTKLYAGKSFHYNSCTPAGPAQTAFPNTVQYIDVLDKFSRWRGKHTDQDRWYAPNGRLYFQSNVVPFTGHGPTTDCGFLRVAGKPAARLLGRWTYRLFVDGFLASTATFTLTRGAAAAGTSFTYTNPQTNDTTTVSNPFIDRTGDATFPPPAGDEFFVMHVRLRNGGTRDHGYFGLDYHARDQNGTAYDRTIEYPDRDGTYIGFGTINAGETKTGVVVYAVPKDTKWLALSWDDDSSISPPHYLGTFYLK